MAYHFKWQRGDIFGMTIQERRVWLSQIDRIHNELKRARDRELTEQVEYLENLRSQE